MKTIACSVAGLFFLLVASLGFTGRSDWNPLVKIAEQTAEDIAISSAAVYVSLRVINAALSTAQEIEVGASVVGQANLQPLKVLEPVDDTIERVADAVFLVATGAALATVGLAPVVSIGLTVLGIALVGKAIAIRKPGQAETFQIFFDKGVHFGISVGFMVPFTFALGVWAGEQATETKMNDAQVQLDALAEQANILIGAQAINAAKEMQQADEDQNLLNWFSEAISDAKDGVSEIFQTVGQYLDAAQVFIDEADKILQSSLTIIGIFALRMIVLPTFLLWGALSLLKSNPRKHAPE